jgi:hypothetical protein
MPTLIHFADEKQSKMIFKNGLKPGKNSDGIYCMPVLPNFYVTHQWLRELKSSGIKTLVGVYFKIDSDELVYAGKYGQNHRHITLGKAIAEIMGLEDPLGYELIIDRKIKASEIVKIKQLPQTIGWRYRPDSHNQKPCVCEYCIRGTIKADRLRKKAKLA